MSGITRFTESDNNPKDLSNQSSDSGIKSIKFSSKDFCRSLVYKDKNLQQQLLLRHKMRIFDGTDDVTPKPFVTFDKYDFGLELESAGSLGIHWGEPLEKFPKPIDFDKHSVSIFTAELDDLTSEIPINFPVEPSVRIDDHKELLTESKGPNMPKYIKVTFSETEIVLFESNSSVVPEDSPDIEEVLKDNEKYEWLISKMGQMSQHKTSNEAQTFQPLTKPRGTNTDRNFQKIDIGTSVTNLLYNNKIDEKDEKNDFGDDQKVLEFISKKSRALTFEEKLSKNKKFKFYAMIIERLLASNGFQKAQGIFRNKNPIDPASLEVKCLYRLEKLWEFKMLDFLRQPAVSCFSWCPSNGELLAVGYGVYNWVTFEERKNGWICIWSIKNPIFPERKYTFEAPVTSVEFSKKNPNLLAVGLYDGAVKILDICKYDRVETVKTECKLMEPIWKIRWLFEKNNEELLVISQKGYVIRYHVVHGAKLYPISQVKFDEIAKTVHLAEIDGNGKWFLAAQRSPQALTMEVNPITPDLYYIGTSDGFIHIGTVLNPFEHSTSFRAHQSNINSIEFSPFSPRIFLTASDDFTIRIWIDELFFEPIIELFFDFRPIHMAHWSPIHPTIIVCSTKSNVLIWNLRKSIFKPAIIHNFDQTTSLTVFEFSLCGHSIVIGDNDGCTTVCALKDMPIPPHYKYEALQSAIFKSLRTKPDLLFFVKSLGYLGYSKKKL